MLPGPEVPLQGTNDELHGNSSFRRVFSTRPTGDPRLRGTRLVAEPGIFRAQEAFGMRHAAVGTQLTPVLGADHELHRHPPVHRCSRRSGSKAPREPRSEPYGCRPVRAASWWNRHWNLTEPVSRSTRHFGGCTPRDWICNGPSKRKFEEKRGQPRPGAGGDRCGGEAPRVSGDEADAENGIAGVSSRVDAGSTGDADAVMIAGRQTDDGIGHMDAGGGGLEWPFPRDDDSGPG